MGFFLQLYLVVIVTCEGRRTILPETSVKVEKRIMFEALLDTLLHDESCTSASISSRTSQNPADLYEDRMASTSQVP